MCTSLLNNAVSKGIKSLIREKEGFDISVHEGGVKSGNLNKYILVEIASKRSLIISIGRMETHLVIASAIVYATERSRPSKSKS